MLSKGHTSFSTFGISLSKSLLDFLSNSGSKFCPKNGVLYICLIAKGIFAILVAYNLYGGIMVTQLLLFISLIIGSQLYPSQVSKVESRDLSAEIKTAADREEKSRAEQSVPKQIPLFLQREHTKLLHQLESEEKLTDAVKRKVIEHFVRLKHIKANAELLNLIDGVHVKHHILFVYVPNQEFPELLNLNEIEALSCETFQELLDAQIKHHDPLVVARVITDDKNDGSHHVHYFDADMFNRYRYGGYPLTDAKLAAPTKPNNPLNRQAIKQIQYFAYTPESPERGLIYLFTDTDFSHNNKDHFKYWLMAYQNFDKEIKNNALKELFFVAAASNNLELIKYFIDRGVHINAQTNDVGNTALIVAAIYEHPQAIKMLLEGGADSYIKNGAGWTFYDFAQNKPVLHKIIREFHHQKRLQQRAPTPAWARKATELEEKMLYDSLWGRLTEQKLQAYLKNGADINAHNIINNTLMARASKDNDMNAIILFLKYGADPNLQDLFGISPLSAAASKGNAQLVNLLILHDANLDAQDLKGFTPLMKASTKNIIIMLLNAGANPYMRAYDAKTIIKNHQTMHNIEFYKKNAKEWSNQTFFTRQAALLQDPAIQEALAHNQYVIQEKKKLGNLMLQETPLPTELINIVKEYKGIALDAPEEEKKEQDEEWCVIA